MGKLNRECVQCGKVYGAGAGEDGPESFACSMACLDNWRRDHVKAAERRAMQRTTIQLAVRGGGSD